jgi:hypothetical protein
MRAFGKDPVAFIRHNLLTLDSQLDDPAPSLLFRDGTVRVKLMDITSTYIAVSRNRNRKGLAKLIPVTQSNSWKKAACIYRVVPAGPFDNDAFAAYICPYVDKSTKTKVLGADADVMFTGDMDGCSFGIGMPTPQGAVRVGHANALHKATGTQFNPNFWPQREAQRKELVKNGVAEAIVDPNRYRDNAPAGWERKAITIGLRIGGGWRFYYQHQQTDGPGGDREKLATIEIT